MGMQIGAKMKHLFQLGFMEEDINPSAIAQKHTKSSSWG